MYIPESSLRGLMDESSNNMDSFFFFISRFSFPQKCLLPGPLWTLQEGIWTPQPKAELLPSDTGITSHNLSSGHWHHHLCWALLLPLSLPRTSISAVMKSSESQCGSCRRKKKKAISSWLLWKRGNVGAAHDCFMDSKNLKGFMGKKKIEDGQVKF